MTKDFWAALRVLQTGGLIIYPTDTAYGLGADATNHKALEKLLKYKGARNSPVSIAVCNLEMAKKFVKITPLAQTLYQKYLPGALTIISPTQPNVDEILTAGSKTLGIRILNFPPALELIRAFGRPITATSANISRGPTPYSKQEYLATTPPEKAAMIDYFWDAGPLPKTLPSTIVKVVGENLEIIRQGGLKI